jgi:hypothetical protein
MGRLGKMRTNLELFTWELNKEKSEKSRFSNHHGPIFLAMKMPIIYK